MIVSAVKNCVVISLLVILSGPLALAQSSSVVFVLDRSGSMVQNDPYAFSAVAANVALDYLELLDPNVQVGVVEFSDTSESLTDDQLYPASRARRSLDAQRLRKPAGGTSMMAAMRHAFTHLSSATGAKRIVLLADGQPSDSFDVTQVITTAKRQNIQIFAIGIKMGADRQFLNEIASQTGGAAEFVESSADMIVAVREMFTDKQQRLWNVNQIFEERVPNGQDMVRFSVGGGADRMRVTLSVENYTAFRESELDIAIMGPSSPGPESFHNVYIANRTGGEKVAVWTSLMTDPRSGTYEIRIAAGAPPGSQHGGVQVYVDSYSDIEVEARLAPSADNALSAETSVDVFVSVTDGSGDAVDAARITGAVSSVTGSGGASVTCPNNGPTCYFITPKEPGEYVLTVQADVGGETYPIEVPIRFRVVGAEPVELFSDPVNLASPEDLGFDRDTLVFGFTLLYRDESRSPAANARSSIPVTAEWVQELTSSSGTALTPWVTLEAGDGGSIKLDGRRQFRLPEGGATLNLSIALPDPEEEQRFRLLEDGTYKGILRFSSPEARDPVEVSVTATFRKPTLEVTRRSGPIVFFWDPSTQRRIPLLRVSANYEKESKFEIRIPTSIQVDAAQFAELALLRNGEELPRDPGLAKQTHGPFTLSREPVDFDLVVTPTLAEDRIFFARRPPPIEVELIYPYSFEAATAAFDVNTMGASPRPLPILGKIQAPIIGPFSLYMSHLVAWCFALLFAFIFFRRIVAFFMEFPVQQKWREKTTIRTTLPQALSISGTGNAKTLTLPRRWTQLRRSGHAAKLRLGPDDQLLIGDPRPNTVTVEDDFIVGDTELNIRETFGVGEESRRGKTVPWLLRYLHGSSGDGSARFRIVRSPYSLSISRWLIRLVVLAAGFSVLIIAVRSQGLAYLIYQVDSSILQGALSNLMSFLHG